MGVNWEKLGKKWCLHKEPEISEPFIWFPSWPLRYLQLHILHLVKPYVSFHFRYKDTAKMVRFSYFSQRFKYLLRSKCSNKFGMVRIVDGWGTKVVE